ncbi:MAG: antibiotic biosynthesis monooxygenase [Thermoguttaceae bacterium]|nr:antibiotic biosynthesis monooxygenase [Thermoguttaceae bacterium]
MISVLATIELAPGRREDFLAEFRRIMPLVRQERGCIEYIPMIDLPTSIGAQIPARENVVTIVEKWESVEALQDHLMAPHMNEYRKAVKDLVVRTELLILEPAG